MSARILVRSRLAQVPELKVLDEPKARARDHYSFGGLIVAGEVEGRVENALEARDQALVIAAVLGQAEGFKDGGGGAKADFAVLLPGGHGGNPDQEEAVLAKREAIIRVANDPEAKSAIAAGVFECLMVWSADGNAAKHERTGAIGSLGTTLRILGTRDGVELLKFALGEWNLRKDGTDRCRSGRFRSSREGVGSETR